MRPGDRRRPEGTVEAIVVVVAAAAAAVMNVDGGRAVVGRPLRTAIALGGRTAATDSHRCQNLRALFLSRQYRFFLTLYTKARTR